MIRATTAVWVLAWVLAGATHASAQAGSPPPAKDQAAAKPTTGPAQKPPAAGMDSKLIEGNAGLSFVAATGTNTTQTVGSQTAVTWRPGPWEVSHHTNWTSTRTDGLVTAESLTVDTRAARTVFKRFAALFEYDYLHNPSAAFPNRHTATIGVEYRALRTASQSLKVRFTAGYDNLAGPRGTPGKNILLGAVYKAKLPRGIGLEQETRVFQSLDVIDRRQLYMRTLLDFPITSVLSLKFAHQLRLFSVVQTGKPDTFTTTSLIVAFRF